MFGVETLLPPSNARLEPFGMHSARVREERERERFFSTQRDVRGVIKELPALIRFGHGTVDSACNFLFHVVILSHIPELN